MSIAWLELKAASRSLAAQWASNALGMAALGLSAAGTIAILALVNTVLLRPLPFERPETLYAPFAFDLTKRSSWKSLSPEQVDALRRPGSPAAAVTAFVPGEAFAATPTEAEQDGVVGSQVDARFWSVLGAAPVRGRPLLDSDRLEVATPPVVVSDRLWRTRYAGSDTLIGSTVTLGGRTVRVVGIMPPIFDFPAGTNVWFPLEILPRASRFEYLQTVLRIPADPLAVRAAAETGASMIPIARAIRPGQSATLLLFIVAGVITFAIGWIQVASLQISRTVAEARQLSTRRALGAGPFGTSAPVVTRAVLLAAGALLIAVAVLPSYTGVLATTLPGEIVGSASTSTSVGRTEWTALVVLIAAGMSMFVGASAVLLRWRGPSAMEGQGSTASRASQRLLDGVTVVQLAVTGILLHVAVLLGVSYAALLRTDLGFEPGGLYTAAPRVEGLDPRAARGRLAQMEAELKTIHGIAGAAVTDVEPLGTGGLFRPVSIGKLSATVRWRLVGRDYFAVVGARLAGGAAPGAMRAFEGDVAVISASLARKLPAGVDPATLWVNDTLRRFAVVGVLAEMRNVAGAAASPDEVYVPAQTSIFSARKLVLRVADRDPRDTLVDVQRLLVSRGGAAALPGLAPVSDWLRRQQAPVRTRSTLLVLFSATALIVAIVGVYSSVSHTVAMRAREFAIRASMGASPARLRRGVVMGTWRLVATAGVLATVAGGAAGHVMRAYLYGIGPLDPLIVLAVLAVLFCCGAGAALVAARHAAVASPAEMLRGT